MDNEQAKIMKYLERLAGTWIGEGLGEYPTIASFPYRESLTFTPGEGKAYLHFEQRTWRKDQSGQEIPSHWETGFWRVLSKNEIELICAQASGRLEVARGQLLPNEDGFLLGLRSSIFANDTGTEQTWREFDLNGSSLRYFLKMQTPAVPELTLHVHARLKRSS